MVVVVKKTSQTIGLIGPGLQILLLVWCVIFENKRKIVVGAGGYRESSTEPKQNTQSRLLIEINLRKKNLEAKLSYRTRDATVRNSY